MASLNPPEPVQVTIKGETYEFYIMGLDVVPHGGATGYAKVGLSFLVNRRDENGLKFVFACRDAMYPEEIAPEKCEAKKKLNLRLIEGGAKEND